MRVQDGDQSGPQQERITQLRNAVYDTLKVSHLTSTENCSNDKAHGISAASCASVVSSMAVPFVGKASLARKQ